MTPARSLARNVTRSLAGLALLVSIAAPVTAATVGATKPAKTAAGPASDAEFEAFLAAGKKAIVMPCQFPSPQTPESQVEVEALLATGKSWETCMREHDQRMKRWHAMEESASREVASRLSGPQVETYRSQLREAISQDVQTNRPRINQVYAEVREALAEYEWKTRPDAPQSVLDELTARLDAYDYDCRLPPFPSEFSRSTVDAFNGKVTAFKECDTEWMSKVDKLQAKGLEGIFSNESTGMLSYAQTKVLYDQLLATRSAINQVLSTRVSTWNNYMDELQELDEARKRRQSEREAEEQDRRESAAVAEATRQAIKRAGDAALGNNGRYVPIPIPKRPGQP